MSAITPRLQRRIERDFPEPGSATEVARLACLRGVSTLTAFAFALAVEIGDWHRFTGNSIGSFVGLVPSEHSSGASRVQGSITKTGNTHARRLLVEAAWHHRTPNRPGKTIRDAWELATPGSTSPRRPGQPATTRPQDELQPAPQATRHRQRRHRPRTSRLVLVPGRHGLTRLGRPSSPSRCNAARGATRVPTMSSQPYKLGHGRR
jgi:Transposase IS116/IS110/IS902 family